jgi:phosphoglycolate phosphatase-like HAD superfamily hydrolase
MTPSSRRLLGWLLLAAFLAPAGVGAEIRETQRMAEALADVRPGDLVVVDLDNTLIRPSTGLGSDEWFYHLEARIAERDGLPPEQAADRAMEIWNAVQSEIQVRPVEATAPRLLRSLQARGVRILGLTARTHDIAEVTRRQLASVGIDLGPSRPRRMPWSVQLRDVARYHDGILFVGEHNDKGEVLAAFLQQMGRAPARVLFVDDRIKHVRAVDGALAQHGVPCTAFRYGAADEIVAGFDAAAADLEYAAMIARP